MTVGRGVIETHVWTSGVCSRGGRERSDRDVQKSLLTRAAERIIGVVVAGRKATGNKTRDERISRNVPPRFSWNRIRSGFRTGSL